MPRAGWASWFCRRAVVSASSRSAAVMKRVLMRPGGGITQGDGEVGLATPRASRTTFVALDEGSSQARGLRLGHTAATRSRSRQVLIPGSRRAGSVLRLRACRQRLTAEGLLEEVGVAHFLAERPGRSRVVIGETDEAQLLAELADPSCWMFMRDLTSRSYIQWICWGVSSRERGKRSSSRSGGGSRRGVPRNLAAQGGAGPVGRALLLECSSEPRCRVGAHVGHLAQPAAHLDVGGCTSTVKSAAAQRLPAARRTSSAGSVEALDLTLGLGAYGDTPRRTVWPAKVENVRDACSPNRRRRAAGRRAHVVVEHGTATPRSTRSPHVAAEQRRDPLVADELDVAARDQPSTRRNATAHRRTAPELDPVDLQLLAGSSRNGDRSTRRRSVRTNRDMARPR